LEESRRALLTVLKDMVAIRCEQDINKVD